MKKFYLIALLICICSNLYAQTTFEKVLYHPNEEWEQANDICITSSGEILVLTSIESGTSLYKLNEKGDTLWRKVLQHPEGKILGKRICTGADNGYIIGGDLKYGDYYHIYLQKIDDNGNQLWEKRIGDSNSYNYCNDLISISGEGYAIAGQMSTPLTRPALLKVDLNGDLIWANNSITLDGISDPNSFTPRAVVKTPEGYVIGGEYYKDAAANTAIAKLDDSGNLLQNTQTLSIENEFLRSLHYCSDGSYAFAGRFEYDDNGSLRSNLWFGKYDSNLNILWNKNTYTPNNLAGEDIVEDAEANLLIAGNIDKAEYSTDPYLIKVNSEGTMLWEKFFGSNLGGQLQRIKLNGDFIYGSGYHWGNAAWGIDGNNNRAYVLKTDANGDVNHLRIINASNNICEGEEREIKVYDFMQSYEWDTKLDVDKSRYGIIVDKKGKYSVSAVDKNGNKRFSDTLTIYTGAIPEIVFTEESKFCGDGDKILSTEKEYDSYEWFFNDLGETLTSIGNEKNQLVDKSGKYRVQVKDENGCLNQLNIDDDNYTIAYESAELKAFVADSTNISRSDLSDGSATIGVKGGNPPYSYLWEESGSISNTANNLKADHFYHVTVFDDKGCQTRVSFVLKVIPVVENSLCNFSKVGDGLQLNDTYINAIERDSEGKLWFANRLEIGKYDGSDWDIIETTNEFECVHVDKNKNIWAGTDFNGLGLHKYDGNSWTTFNKEDGLAGMDVRDIEEDQYGNLWFATSEGLSRYNGTEFVNFAYSDGLLDANIYSLKIDNKDQLWIGSNDGVTRFKILNDNKIDSCATFIVSSEGKSIGGIKNLEEDKDGNIWASSDWVEEGESGLLKFQAGEFIRINPNLNNTLTWIYDIYADANGGVWIATDNGVGYLSNDAWYQYSSENGLLSDKVSAIGEDLFGNIWLGFNPGEGLSKFKDGNWVTYNTQSELLNSGVNNSTLDKDKNLWVSVDYGSNNLQKFDGTGWFKFSEEDGFTGFIYELASDSKGNVWIATDIGLYKYTDNQFEKLSTEDGLKANKVMGVTVDKNDDVWLRFDGQYGISKYSNNQFVSYTQNEGLLDNTVNDIQADSLGNMWVFYSGRKFNKYDGNAFSEVEVPLTPAGNTMLTERAFVDSQNRVWVAFEQHVAVFENDSWTFYDGDDHGVSSEYYPSIFGEDAAKNVILAYYKDLDQGETEAKLVQYSGESWVDIEPNNALPGSTVYCIQDDFKGNLWYGTASGLLKYTKCTNEEVLISVNNGSCSGDGNRSLIITPTGGNHPYQYSIDNGKTFQTDSIFADLQADTYHLLVKNKNGELVTDRQLTITEPLPLIVNVEGFNVTCTGRTDGAAICKPTGGLSPYTYLWDDSNASTTSRIENLEEGVEYTVTVTDANGCSEIATISVGHDPLLKFTDKKDVSCYGLTDGMAVITPIGGKAPFTYQWDDVNNTSDSIVNSLGGGKFHFVTVTDANNCVSIDSIKLNQPEPILVEVKSFNSCGEENSGGIEAIVSGGTLPYEYLWNDTNNSTTKDLYDLSAGSYTLTVKDHNSCETTETANIEQLEKVEDVNIISNKGEYFCPNTTELSANGDFSSYKWSTGSTDKLIAPPGEGKYWLRVYNDEGCSDIDTISIAVLNTYQEQNLCIVSVNSDNKNEIVWARRDGYGIDSYNIYKESNTSSQYELVSNMPFDQESLYIDEDSDPAARSHTYAISIVDVCGVESEMSEEHRTMLLQASYGVNGAINLAWNKYLGLDFDTYHIYRGTSLDDLQLLTSISNSESKYIDNSAPGEEEFLYYVLQIEAPDVCDPATIKSSIYSYAVSSSNVVDAGNKTTGIVERKGKVEKLTVYPNPMTDRCYAQFENQAFKEYTLRILDARGSVVYQRKGIKSDQVEIPRGNLSSGTYIIELRGDKIYRGRLIVR
ncbi:two-component regulator propeller domain-containing protein [Marinifilum caeruleilacunae]|uniref:T9SS type A sorting domain-containing protein n=1 Tax=Marinifilum caeruleilacunae TaxID=2499076 RepID=A0ABX1WZI3_9BACT|nr:two-component regulator propeller domain-containing protein [Marinifilum caeruleilacunae]NOU61544.1 T9SS type A sorting domain-containing protein [Marinifilum caeruleilacunae]